MTEEIKLVGVEREDGEGQIESNNCLWSPLNGTAAGRSGQMLTFMQIKKKPLCEIFLPFCVLQFFIVALSFAGFSKALTGTYMKSSITQIERRFDLSSTHIGLIDGSFEMGNGTFMPTYV